MIKSRTSVAATAQNSGCGKLLLVPFGAIFLAAGLFFEGLIARDFLKTVAGYGWEQVPCVMTASEVKPDPKQTWPNQDFLVLVSYRYTAGGREQVSTVLSAGKSVSFSDYGEAQRLADRFAEGTRTICYVNPQQPREAVLQRGSLWMGFALLFPLIFVAVGGGIMWAGIRSFRPVRPAEEKVSKPAPLSEKPRFGGRGVLVLVFGVFLALGGSMTYMILLRPVLGILQARGWVATPCQVAASGVRSHRGDKSTTYSVNILFSYEVAGRPYMANRYSFFTGSSSGYEGKAAIAQRYQPGSWSECFVNPKEPTEAVLVRGFTPAAWVGLIPLAFAMIGAGGLYGVLRRKPPGTKSSLHPVMGGVDRLRGGVAEQGSGGKLKSISGPLGRLLGGIAVALFWNGIVSVFLWQLIQSGRRHHFEWGLALFLIPFVLIGLVMIGFVFYSLLALFNPRPSLVVTPPEAVPGQPIDVSWRFSGRAGVLRRVTIRLKGREEATCQQGDKTGTEKRDFATFDLVDTTVRGEMVAGQARFQVPPRLMHSWKTPNHRIVWVLHVQGVIDRWPDVNQEFVINMRPAPAGPAQPPSA
jgi:hypothetical protein